MLIRDGWQEGILFWLEYSLTSKRKRDTALVINKQTVNLNNYLP
jgi:hypothetical protein